MGRFVKGQSGNPDGRPRARRPNVSAFDIIFDRRLIASQGGVERGLTVDEALQMQTYNDALKGKRMAVRSVLTMIEKREKALQTLQKRVQRVEPTRQPVLVSYDSDSANEAMLLLEILCTNSQDQYDRGPRPLLVQKWAAQTALSKPGRSRGDGNSKRDLHLFVRDFASIKMPRGG